MPIEEHYVRAGPISVSCRYHAAGPFVLLMPEGGAKFWCGLCPQRSPRPGLWLTYYPIQTTAALCCLTNKKMSQSSNQADFSRGREQQGEENWQEGELGGGNIKEGNNISVRGNKKGNLRPFTACHLITLGIYVLSKIAIDSKAKDGLNFLQVSFFLRY